MSYGSRTMKRDDDLLFRAKVTFPEQTITVPLYDTSDGRIVKVGEAKKLAPESVRYVGPYTAVGPARAAVNKAKKQIERSGKVGTAELEACAPEWKVME